jgi:hypothetical protein
MIIQLLIWLWLFFIPEELYAENFNITSPVYWNNSEDFMYSSNRQDIPIPILQSSLNVPNVSTETIFDGFDLTKPFPGTKISGFKAHLRASYDVTISNGTVNDETTSLSAITFGVPSVLIEKGGTIKNWDPSWFICRGLYVSLLTNLTESQKKDDQCGFISSECSTDLRKEYTKNWMRDPKISRFPCAETLGDTIPRSCSNWFGAASADVIGKYVCPDTNS